MRRWRRRGSFRVATVRRWALCVAQAVEESLWVVLDDRYELGPGELVEPVDDLACAVGKAGDEFDGRRVADAHQGLGGGVRVGGCYAESVRAVAAVTSSVDVGISRMFVICCAVSFSVHGRPLLFADLGLAAVPGGAQAGLYAV